MLKRVKKYYIYISTMDKRISNNIREIETLLNKVIYELIFPNYYIKKIKSQLLD